eukprot:365628-Chlamydomonas_euryale.AAC.5
MAGGADSGWLAGRSVAWLVGWLIGWLVGWLIGRLVRQAFGWCGLHHHTNLEKYTHLIGVWFAWASVGWLGPHAVGVSEMAWPTRCVPA